MPSTMQTQNAAALFGLEPGLLRNPYDLYARWREQGPVIYLPEQQIYVVTRHRDIRAVNRQPERFSSRNPFGPGAVNPAVLTAQALAGVPEDDAAAALLHAAPLISADPPEHTRQRRLLQVALDTITGDRMRSLGETISRSRVASLPRRAVIDLIDRFATPLPLHCLAALMNVPALHHADLQRWARAINTPLVAGAPQQRVQEVIAAQRDCCLLLTGLLRAREQAPGNDLLSAIANAVSAEDAPLALSEQAEFCLQLIVAGAGKTASLIGFATLYLAQNVSIQALLRENPELIPAFTEEMLRLEPPLQGMFRIAMAATEIAGTPIPEGAYLWLLYGSGNRDSTVFNCPHDIDHRGDKDADHLSFGSGVHSCPGADLAREIGAASLRELLTQTSAVSLATDATSLTVQPSCVVHSLVRLPVILA